MAWIKCFHKPKSGSGLAAITYLLDGASQVNNNAILFARRFRLYWSISLLAITAGKSRHTARQLRHTVFFAWHFLSGIKP
jgi:hypothetical protein